MIIVTGGAGFIGSNIVKALNEEGIERILVVDNLSNAEKIKNLSGLRIIDFMDKHEFYEFMSTGNKFELVSAVFHQGACSDTMETDGKYVLHNNFTYSKALFHFSQAHHAQFIYASSASVYGSGTEFAEEPENESTLNAYAWSKLLFDNFIRSFHSNQFIEHGKVRLFSGTDGYADGEQLRDFVFVDDVVAVNLFLLKNPGISGVFNVGTGRCQSFNDVALAVINNCRQQQNKDPVGINDAVANGEIVYIPMPVALLGKYQSYTQADLNKLRSAGYDGSFSTVTHGVKEYISCLES
jgi:ADP-L-glycero-D-manno-heptose 6-epimerase